MIPDGLNLLECAKEQTRKFIREELVAALERTHGNMAAAGRELGIHKNTVVGYCDRMGVDPSVFKSRRKRA